MPYFGDWKQETSSDGNKLKFSAILWGLPLIGADWDSEARDSYKLIPNLINGTIIDRSSFTYVKSSNLWVVCYGFAVNPVSQLVNGISQPGMYLHNPTQIGAEYRVGLANVSLPSGYTYDQLIIHPGFISTVKSVFPDTVDLTSIRIVHTPNVGLFAFYKYKISPTAVNSIGRVAQDVQPITSAVSTVTSLLTGSKSVESKSIILLIIGVAGLGFTFYTKGNQKNKKLGYIGSSLPIIYYML